MSNRAILFKFKAFSAVLCRIALISQALYCPRVDGFEMISLLSSKQFQKYKNLYGLYATKQNLEFDFELTNKLQVDLVVFKK